MILIQYLLVSAVVGLLVLLLRHHGTARSSAGTKIAFILFIVFAIFAVLEPSIVTEFAQWLGVGRGTDLLVYGLVAGLGFASLHTYLRFKDLEERHAKLVRAVALRSAENSEQLADDESAS